MRALMILVPVLLAGCGTAVPQHEILKRSKAEISMREPWSDTAAILVEQTPGDLRFTWKLRAGAFDYSDYPSYKGIRLVSGTERELRYTRDGCLVEYSHSANRCPPPYAITTTTEVLVPDK